MRQAALGYILNPQDTVIKTKAYTDFQKKFSSLRILPCTECKEHWHGTEWPDVSQRQHHICCPIQSSPHVKQHKSWSKCWSLTPMPATLSWLDSVLPQSNLYDASMKQRAWCSTLFHNPHWLPEIVLAEKAVSGTVPTYLKTLVRPPCTSPNYLA